MSKEFIRYYKDLNSLTKLDIESKILDIVERLWCWRTYGPDVNVLKTCRRVEDSIASKVTIIGLFMDSVSFLSIGHSMSSMSSMIAKT